ncbi:MAG: transposase IS605 [Mycoplasmataceae bacterium RC_NB112A]|nr:MAG: transposase IS605 [Mycoplasmataceae bacterium RC_NB112A]
MSISKKLTRATISGKIVQIYKNQNNGREYLFLKLQSKGGEQTVAFAFKLTERWGELDRDGSFYPNLAKKTPIFKSLIKSGDVISEAWIGIKNIIMLKKARAEQELDQIIAECCWLYNYFLQIWRERDQNKQKQPTKNEQEKLLIELKEQRPQLKLIFSRVLQNVANLVNETWKNYRQHKRVNSKAGYPRFKPLNKYNSFTYKQFGFKLKGDKLILSCGKEKEELILNVRLHRELEGKTKTLSIIRKNGKYF